MKLNDLKEKKLSDLREVAKTMNIEKVKSFSKDELIAEIMKNKKQQKQKAPFCIQVSRYVRVNQDVLNERAKKEQERRRKEYLKEAFPFYDGE